MQASSENRDVYFETSEVSVSKKKDLIKLLIPIINLKEFTLIQFS